PHHLARFRPAGQHRPHVPIQQPRHILARHLLRRERRDHRIPDPSRARHTHLRMKNARGHQSPGRDYSHENAAHSPAPSSAIAALRLSLMRPWSSMRITFTFTMSPIFTTSCTLLTYPSASSEMWHIPSVPGASSMKAPKSFVLTTLPV